MGRLQSVQLIAIAIKLQPPLQFGCRRVSCSKANRGRVSEKVRRKLNETCSKMILKQTGREIADGARTPAVDVQGPKIELA